MSLLRTRLVGATVGLRRGVPAQDLPPTVAEDVVEAPVPEGWRAWTTDDGLRTWLAPPADIDIRPGGLTGANYDAAGSLGVGGTFENTVLAYDPGRMLAIRISKAPRGFPFSAAVAQMWTSSCRAGSCAAHARVPPCSRV